MSRDLLEMMSLRQVGKRWVARVLGPGGEVLEHTADTVEEVREAQERARRRIEAREAAPLPLTRAVMAWWPKWRHGTERERQHMRTIVSETAIRTLERFAANLAAWSGKPKDAARLLEGLRVPEADAERLVPELVRAAGLIGWPERELERALREVLGCPETTRGKPQATATESGFERRSGLTAFAARKDAATIPKPHAGRPRFLTPRTPKEKSMSAAAETAAETEPAAQNGYHTVGDRLAAALEQRGLRLDQSVPIALHPDLARECDTTTKNISNALGILRRKAGIRLRGDSHPAADAEQPRAAHPEPEEALMFCGHPQSDVESSDEGTSFCRSCARESLEAADRQQRAEELDQVRENVARAMDCDPCSLAVVELTREQDLALEVGVLKSESRRLRAEQQLTADRDDWRRRALAAEDLVRPRPEPEPCACPATQLSLAERRRVLHVAHQLANDATLALDFGGLEWPVRCAILSEAIFIVAGLLGDES